MKAKEIIIERTADAMDLANLLRAGSFSDTNELRTYLDKKYSIVEIGEGNFSTAYSGSGGKDYVFKISHTQEEYINDSWWEFAEAAKEYASTNSLFPKILYSGELSTDGGNQALGIALLEYVNVGDAGIPRSYPYEVLDAIMSSRPNEKKRILDFLDQSYQHLDAYQFADFIEKTMRKLSGSPMWDMHKYNCGTRADGSLVVFDPVSFK